MAIKRNHLSQKQPSKQNITRKRTSAAYEQQGILARLCLTFYVLLVQLIRNKFYVFRSGLTLPVSVAFNVPFFSPAWTYQIPFASPLFAPVCVLI